MPKLARSIWNELQGLGAQEIEIIKKFEQDSTGTLFISAAEVLRKRGYIDEAIVIMEDGVKAYPQYHGARAALARDYYLKGLMNEAEHHISLVVGKSIDNPMAQRLKLKIDLLFDRFPEVEERLAYIKNLFPDDEFTKMIRVHAGVQDWEGAKNLVTAELSRFGIAWNPNEMSSHADVALSRLGGSLDGEVIKKEEHIAWEIPKENNNNAHLSSETLTFLPNKEEEMHLPEALRSGATLASVRGNPEKYFGLRGFKRVKAKGFFEGATSGKDEKLSIDLATLAEIYVSQGLVAKAVMIYERLSRSNENNHQYYGRINELKKMMAPSVSKGSLQNISQNLSEKKENRPIRELQEEIRSGGASEAYPQDTSKNEIPPKVLRKIQVLENLLKQIEKRKAALA